MNVSLPIMGYERRSFDSYETFIHEMYVISAELGTRLSQYSNRASRSFAPLEDRIQIRWGSPASKLHPFSKTSKEASVVHDAPHDENVILVRTIAAVLLG